MAVYTSTIAWARKGAPKRPLPKHSFDPSIQGRCLSASRIFSISFACVNGFIRYWQ